MKEQNMFTHYKSIAVMILVLALLTGCGTVEPTATPLPATATRIALEPTHTSSPPTATRPTVAPAPPTATPTATSTATAVAAAPEEPSATPTEAAPQPTATPTTRPGYFSQEQLIEDARQLAEIIESTHPDPYINGGGRVAFHRRLQRVLHSIPQEGMRREEFVRLLIPFVAGVGDGHTVLDDEYPVSRDFPGGVPFYLAAIEETLYVAGVPRGIDTDLLGSLLVSVEGIPVAELCKRQERMEGVDNYYHALQSLIDESIHYEPYMQDLIPEWEDTSRVTVELQRPTGKIEAFTFDLPIRMRPMIIADSQVTLPSTGRSGFTYEFMDEEGRLAYLRVDNLQNYAEANPASPTSATETFRKMVTEMADAGTETLIVDLRDNYGGSSLMGDILVYFLYGREALDQINSTIMTTGGCGSRLSAVYFKYYSGDIRPEDVGQSPMLVMGDYDFSRDFAALQEIYQEMPDPAEILSLIDSGYANSAMIWYEEYQSEAYSGYYLPTNVIVLVTAETYSSGANMMQFLSRAGAVLVGTPSSQVTNSFGEVAPFALDNTRISGWVSTKYCIQVPPASDAARVWPVDYPLTYEKLAAYDFDPNAEYLYALELISEQE
jgi:hypothetical protein